MQPTEEPTSPGADPLNTYIHSRPYVLGGVPIFRGTRVPAKALFDYVQAGRTVHEFLDHFDGVTPKAVHAVLSAAQADVLKHIRAA